MLKCFLWLILHDRLLTNQMRLKRHTTSSDLCPKCGLYSEDLGHLLRECPHTRDIWTAIKDLNWWKEGCRQPLTEWVVFNLKNKNMFLDNNWYLFFTVILWQIWKSRNPMVFENVNHPIQVNLKSIWNYASEIKEAVSSPLHPNSTASESIYWRFSVPGTLKLNVDGCSKGNPGQAGYGGLLQDETGTWIWGYYGNLGHCSGVEAELWAIYRGLTILFQKGTMNMAIETDAAQAIDLIQNGLSHNSPFRASIEDTKFLMARCTCTLGHTLREGNRVADMLANLGVAQTEHVVMLEDPPKAVRALVVEDMIGVSFVRA
ncbi:hypothetical protein CsSME_00041449 [Camellia sinensis var. sinensis]